MTNLKKNFFHPLCTNPALIGLLPGVQPMVDDQVGFVATTERTVRALERLLVGVGESMGEQHGQLVVGVCARVAVVAGPREVQLAHVLVELAIPGALELAN